MGWNPIEDAIDWVGDQWDDWAEDVVITVATGGLNHAWDYLQPEIPEFETPAFTPNQRIQQALINRKGAVENIPVIYGARRVAPHVTAVLINKFTNSQVFMICTWCEGEIQSISDIRFNGELLVGSEMEASVGQTHHYGTDTQAVDTYAEFNTTEWTTAHQGKGIAYSVFWLTYRQNILTTLPKITALIKGRKVYNVETTTTEWTDNPVYIVRDYMTNTRYGQGIDAARIDDASAIAAAQFCDNNVTPYTGAPVKDRFDCDAIVDTARETNANRRELLDSCGGYIVQHDGQFHIRVKQAGSSTLTIDEQWIHGPVSQGCSGADARFNRMIVTIPDKRSTGPTDEGYGPEDVTIDAPTLLAEDGGRLSVGKITLNAVTSIYQAQMLGEQLLKESRQDKTFACIVDPRGLQIVQGDVIDVSYARFGWTDKPFWVLARRFLPNGLVALSLIEHETTAYQHTVGPEIPTRPDTNLPNPFVAVAPTNLTANSGDAHLLLQSDGTVVTRVLLSWTNLDPYARVFHVEYKRTVDAVWTRNMGTVHAPANTGYVLGVQDGVDYDFRVQTENINGRLSSSYAQVLNHFVIGKSAPPPDVDSFTVARLADGTRIYNMMMLSEPFDFRGYVIRYSLATDPSWEEMKPLKTGTITEVPHEANDPPVGGEFTFACRAVDTTGNLSANPRFVTVTLGLPRLGDALGIFDMHGQGWPGTQTDCFVESATGDLVAESTETWTTGPTTWDDWDGDELTYTTSFEYEHPAIDLGGEATIEPVFSLNSEGDVTITESHAGSDQVYSAFAAIGGVLTAVQYLKFKVALTNSTDQGRLRQSSGILSADRVEEDVTSLDTSTRPAPGGGAHVVGDFRLPITKTYNFIHLANVTFNNVGQAASFEIVDYDTTSGPRVKIYNAAGALFDATVNMYVRGI